MIELSFLQKMMNLMRRIPLYLNSMFAVKREGLVLKVLLVWSTMLSVACSSSFILVYLCLLSLLSSDLLPTNAIFLLLGTVKSDELKWLPGGSEFILSTDKSTSDSSAKTKTYTSFSCSQDSLPEFLDNPIAPKHDDIILAKLGPGQVRLLVDMYHFRS